MTDPEIVQDAHSAARLAFEVRWDRSQGKAHKWLKMVTNSANQGETSLTVLSESLNPGDREALLLLGFRVSEPETRRDICRATGQPLVWSEVTISWGHLGPFLRATPQPEGGNES